MVLRRSLAVVPSLAALMACALPWVTSGTSVRSGFGFARALQAAGVLSMRWEQIGTEIGLVIPALVGCCLGIAVLGYLRLSAVFASIIGISVVILSVVVLTNIRSGVEVGPWFGIFATSAAVSLSLGSAFRKGS